MCDSARHRVPLTVVVLNNREYGVDLPAIAEGLGVKGIRGDSAADLRDVLREALTFDGPALVDVSVAALRGVGPI